MTLRSRTKLGWRTNTCLHTYTLVVWQALTTAQYFGKMLMIGLAKLYLWVACQNEFPTCNSGCNTFKVAAVTLNIRWHERNSGAADPNTCMIKENVCKMLGAKITLAWHTNTFVFVWMKWLSNIQSESLKLEGIELEVFRPSRTFWSSNAMISKNSLLLLYWYCFEYEQMVTEEEVCLHFNF